MMLCRARPSTTAGPFPSPQWNYLSLALSSDFIVLKWSWRVQGQVILGVCRYKFQLILEPVVCADYYSDRLWLSYDYGVVPIVFGPPT